MRVTFIEEIFYGDYRFVVETGTEMARHQLTVWLCEKVNIDYIALSKFTLAEC